MDSQSLPCSENVKYPKQTLRLSVSSHPEKGNSSNIVKKSRFNSKEIPPGKIFDDVSFGLFLHQGLENSDNDYM